MLLHPSGDGASPWRFLRWNHHRFGTRLSRFLLLHEWCAQGKDVAWNDSAKGKDGTQDSDGAHCKDGALNYGAQCKDGSQNDTAKVKDGAKNDFAKGQDCAWNDGARGKKKVPKV